MASESGALEIPAGELPAYIRGRAAFHGLFADLARGKRNWQLATFLALAADVVLAVSLSTLALTSRVQPYIVEVDALGRAQAFGPASALASTDRRVTLSQIATFVRDIRTVIADPVAQGDLVRRSYAFVDQDAALFLNAYFGDPANDPRTLGRELTRTVEVTSILPVPDAGRAAPGTGTWKVTWTETTLLRGSGAAPTPTAWEGYFTTRTVPPTSADARMLLNPLGLYITSINWTQVAGTPITTRAIPTRDTIASGGQHP